MYWYNPTIHTSERVEGPSTDHEALDMLGGAPESAELVKAYGRLREADTPIERALVSVGHEFRLRQPEYRLVLRQGAA